MSGLEVAGSDDRAMFNPAVVVGEALVDVVHGIDGSVMEVAGGSCANVAVALARLGRPTVLGTNYGGDRLGGVLERHLRASGVVVRGRTEDSPCHTSSSVARLDGSGAATYEFDLTWRLDADSLPTQARVVHTGSIAGVLPPGAYQVLDYVKRMRALATISYDVNARPKIFGRPEDARRAVDALAGVSDIVKASDEDISWLFDGWSFSRVADRWLDLGAAAVLITGGSGGASCFAPSGTARVPREPVKVVDTIGAGDTFSAGVIDALWLAGRLGAGSRRELRAMSAEQWSRVLSYASRLAAVTVGRPGADPPHLADLPSSWRDDLLAERPVDAGGR